MTLKIKRCSDSPKEKVGTKFGQNPLNGIRDGVKQSFRGAGLAYIKHMIDTEYLYLYDINRFSHIILHFDTNDVQKYSVDVITCTFRNLI